MAEVDVKLSGITPAVANASATATTFVGVNAGADQRFTPDQTQGGPFFSDISNGDAHGVRRNNLDRWSDIVNVMDFGATGDGSTDDTAAIQAAINAAATQQGTPGPGVHGGTVFFPAASSSYKVTAPITVPNVAGTSIRLQGVNPNTSRIIGSVNGFIFDTTDPALLSPRATASGSFTTASTTITLTANVPASIVAGMQIFDSTKGVAIGTISSISGAIVTLTTTSAINSSGSSDTIAFGSLGKVLYMENLQVKNNFVATNTMTVTGAAAAPGGAIRLAVNSTAGANLNDVGIVSGVGGTAEANGQWQITVVDATHIDLQTSVFANAYTSGGTVVNHGFNYTVGAVRINNVASGLIQNCVFSGWNGFVASYNVFLVSLINCNFQIGALGNNYGTCGLQIGATCGNTFGCNLQGYWCGIMSPGGLTPPETVGIATGIYGCRNEVSVIGVWMGQVVSLVGLTVLGWVVDNLYTEQSNDAVVLQNCTAGRLSNSLFQSGIGYQFNIPQANIVGDGTTVTVTTPSTYSLDSFGWTSGTRKIKILDGPPANPGYAFTASYLTATRISPTKFTYASTVTGPAVSATPAFETSLQRGVRWISGNGNVIQNTLANISATNIQFAGFDLSTTQGVGHNNAMVSCYTAGSGWLMPAGRNKASWSLINCDNPGGTTLDMGGNVAGMVFANLPGQSGVQQTGPADGQEYVIVDSPTPYSPVFTASGSGTPASTQISLTANVPNYITANMTIFNDTTNVILGAVRAKTVVGASGGSIIGPDVSGTIIQFDGSVALASWANGDSITFRPLSNFGAPVTAGGVAFTVKLRYSAAQANWTIV